MAANRYKEYGRSRRIRLGDLEFDPQNRQIKQWFVDKLIREFDFGQWTPPIAQEMAKGGYTLIEGHHHVAAALRHPQVGPDREVVCYVHPPVESDARVGQMYTGISSRVAHSSCERFLGRLRALEPIAVDVAAIIEKSAWEGVKPKKEEGYIHCPQACEWVYRGGVAKVRRKHPEALRFTLGLLSAMYGTGTDATRPGLIKGLGYFAIRYPDVVLAEVEKKAKDQYARAQSVLSEAVSRSAYTREEKHIAVAQIVLDAYNKGRSSRKLPPLS